MKKILALGLIVGAFVAHANVQRPVVQREEIVWPMGYTAGMTMNNAVGLGGRKLTGVPYRLTAISFRITGASGAGAGNTVITVTDGTNTCTYTLPCATSGNSGAYSVTAADGAGTGCTYASTAGLAASVTTAGCTTTQPSATAIQFLGKPL